MHSTRTPRRLRTAAVLIALLVAAAAAFGLQRAGSAQSGAPGISLNAAASFPVDI